MEEFDSYYYCYVYGTDGPKIRHRTFEDAEKEAKRLTKEKGKKVEILKCVAVSVVEPVIVKTSEWEKIRNSPK